MEVLRQLRVYYQAKLNYLVLSIICLAAATGLGLVYPMLLRKLIDDVIWPGNYGEVVWLAATAVSVVAVKACLQFLHGF
ncbi:ABC transporter ATP-binding protein, partial [Paenibacillus barengoltzii]|nr:ABC transporter ATP-binding protein [Paenibacillus barengoltzii]